jgi:hypothetical protein
MMFITWRSRSRPVSPRSAFRSLNGVAGADTVLISNAAVCRTSVIATVRTGANASTTAPMMFSPCRPSARGVFHNVAIPSMVILL